MKNITPETIKYSHYSFTGDRKQLKKIGWTLNRHNGLSYFLGTRDKPDQFGFYMMVAGGMEICIGKFTSYKHSDIIEFILNNKDKPESFWIDDDYKNHQLGKINWFMHKNHKIVSKEENFSIAKKNIIKNLEHIENKDDEYLKIVEDFSITHAGHLPEVRFSLDLVKIILDLNSIKPLEKIIY